MLPARSRESRHNILFELIALCYGKALDGTYAFSHSPKRGYEEKTRKSRFRFFGPWLQRYLRILLALNQPFINRFHRLHVAQTIIINFLLFIRQVKIVNLTTVDAALFG